MHLLRDGADDLEDFESGQGGRYDLYKDEYLLLGKVILVRRQKTLSHEVFDWIGWIESDLIDTT